MSTTKRCISLLLVLGILLGVFAPAAQAAPVEETTTVNTDNVTIEGTNGLGNLLAQEITENQHASETESENYSVGYSVTDLEIVDNMATVTYESMEDAILIVALHTEDGMQLLNSVSQKVVSDEHKVVIAFDGDMPQYFMASAYLLDTYDLSPLCAAYETPLYTQEMQALLASTVDDYASEMVLNLDDNDNTNFAVYADSTIVIEPVKGRNTIAIADDEKAVYIFKNVDEQITSLGKGDVFVYPYSEQEILIVKVASIDLDGSTATITGAPVEMADVFSYVKIESTAGVADAVVHEGTGDDCVTYHGMKQNGAVMRNQESQIHPNAREGDLPVASPSFEFGIEETFEDKEGNQITITGGITLEADVSFQYYISLFSQYICFKADTTLGLHFTVEGKVELFEFELHQVGFDLVPQLVTVSEQPKVQVCINGKIGWEGVMHFSIGLAWGHNVPSQDLCSGPWLESKTTLEVGFSVMVDLQPKLSAKATSLLELVGARLTCPAGFEVVAIPNGQSLGDVFGDQGDSIHSCQQCLKFELYGCVELGAEIVFLDNVKLVNKGDGLTIKIPFKAKLKVPILEAYYSTDHKDFGFGSCPYESYRLTIKVLNSENSPEQGTPVYTKWESWGYTNKYGVLETYVPVGTYQVYTTVEGNELSAEIKITGPDYLQFSPEKTYSSNDPGAESPPSDDSEDGNWWDGIDFGGVWDRDEYGDITDDATGNVHGKCGDQLEWSLNEEGTLRISGTGPMYDFNDVFYRPWENFEDDINHVIIDVGVTSIGKNAFWHCDNLVSVEIPNTVSQIGAYAFAYSWLTSVTIPKSVNVIGFQAFSCCYGLENVVILGEIEEIGVFAFSDSMMSRINIPASVSKIGYGAFDNCYNLMDIYYDGTQRQWDHIVIKDRNDYLREAVIHCSGTADSVENRYGVYFDGGNGTNEHPYLISKAEQLYAMHQNLSASYKLCADIDLSGHDTWIPLGGAFVPVSLHSEEDYLAIYYEHGDVYILDPAYTWDRTVYYEENVQTYYAFPYFTGTFDGGGHTIANLKIRYDDNGIYYGFIGSGTSKISNLNLSNIDYRIEGHNTAQFNAWYIPGVGGIAGICNGMISNCTVSGQIIANNLGRDLNVGGIVGYLYGDGCYQCINYADIFSRNVVPGYDYSYYEWEGEVSCGGIAGAGGYIEQSVNYGNVTAESVNFTFAGGISGDSSDVADSVNLGEVKSTNLYYQYFTVHLHANAGGIIGYGGDVERCVNYGNVSSYAYHNDPEMENSVDPEEPQYPNSASAGGLIGSMYGDRVFDSYNLCNSIVAMQEQQFGQLKPQGDYINRISGYQHSWDLLTSNNYSLSSTTINGQTVSDSYTDSPHGADLAPEARLNQSSYPTLDFESIWVMDEAVGGPVLRFIKEGAKTSDCNVSDSFIPLSAENCSPHAVIGGEYESEVTDEYILKTAKFSDLVPGEQYVMLAMLDMDVDNPLASDNLLGIAQGTAAEDGTLKFHYIQRFYTDVSYVVVCGASNKNLKDAVITFPEMREDGELHVVEPTVIYDGKTLTEGEHYVLVGDVSYTTAGEYTCYVRGIRNYSGLVEYSYTVAEHEHSFTNYISDGNATCTEDGTRTAKCDFCYATDTIAAVGSALGHNFGVWSTLVEPTCTEDGHEYRLCIRCRHIEGRTISAIGHDMGGWQTTIVATCTENGQELSECSRCDYNETRVTEATGHSYEAVVTAPTCTEQGYTTYTCRCGDSYADSWVDALGHDMGQWFTVTEATCTADGSERRECSRCDHSETQVIEATGHNHEAVVTEPTCTETGFTTYTCHCGDSYVTDYTDPLGHSFTNYVSDGNATCTQDGTKTAVCDRCDATDTQIDVGSAHGHDFSEWTVVEEPTQTSDGLESRYCYNCGLEETRVISSLENPFTDVPEGSFYHAPVLWAVENGITNGTTATTFGPDDQCMRAHVVTFLWRAAGSPEPESNHNPFVDVKETDFYYKAVLWAVEKGITNGLDATHFGPLTYCNRAQVVTFLWRAQGQPESTGSDMPFTDVASGAWYETPVRWAVANGITNGMSATTFGINVICNRAQIVTFLYRAYN